MDEQKKYLVNVESNLDEYAKEAAKAREEVERLTVENVKLKGSTSASAEEIEKSNAALKAAQAEYRTAQAQVVSFQKGLNSEKNSRKELNEILKLQQYALGKLGDGYIKDAQGILRVNPLYEEQTKKVRATKEAIILLDKAQLDGRSSVGLYSEAIQGALGSLDQMPGVMGRAASGAKQLGTTFKALMANPVGLVIMAVVAALSLLVKAFKGNDEASEKFAGVMKGIKMVITEVLGRIVSLGQAVVHLFKGEWKQAVASAKDAFTNFGSAIVDAYGAGAEAVKLMNRVEEDEIKLIEVRAKRERDIAALKLKARDADEGSVKQVQYLAAAQALVVANMEDELALQKDRVKATEMLYNATNKNQRTDEQRRELAEERAKLMQLETTALNEQSGLVRRMGTLEGKNDTEKAKALQDQLALEEKIRAGHMKDMESRSKTGVDEFARLEEKYNTEREWEARDIEAGFEYQHLKNRNNIDALNTLVDAEYAALLTSVEYTKLTNNEKLLAEEQYNAAKKNLSDIRIANQIRELDTIANLSGSLSQLFGEQTIAAKGLSVAQALISTYTAGVKAMAELPLGSGPFLRFATLAATIAAGLVQVKNILAVKVPGKGSGGGSVPSGATAITSSMPAQRAFAPSAGSTIFTQPKLSQEQVNALPNPAPQLTAEDIARAVSKLPAPKVTVEDINARVRESKSVEVMGVI